MLPSSPKQVGSAKLRQQRRSNEKCKAADPCRIAPTSACASTSKTKFSQIQQLAAQTLWIAVKDGFDAGVADAMDGQETGADDWLKLRMLIEPDNLERPN